jgi:hypothetical protein
MDEVIGKPMLVMQVRPEFSIIYKASPKIKFKEEHLSTRKEFRDFLSKASRNWKEGTYFLRAGNGTFAQFHVKKGGKVTLHKENKNNVPFLCWSYLGRKK